MDVFLLIPFLSLHTQPFNDFTPGFGLEAQHGQASYAASAFIDSENNRSWYVGAGYFVGDTIRFGVFGGAMNRKLHGTFPFVLPVASFKYLNLIYVPAVDSGYGKVAQALHFQWRIGFE